MPGFGNIYRQCLCGFWWFGWLRGLDKVCGGGWVGGGVEKGRSVAPPAAALRPSAER